MNNKDIKFYQEFYSEDLLFINGVKFTPREIDIMACLLSARGTSKISSFLSIAPKTVGNHIHNITRKLECNARDGIIDFIERSDKFSLLRKHYSNLLVYAAFKKCLKNIARLTREKQFSCRIVYWSEQNSEITLISNLESDLKLSGINVSIEFRKKFQSFDELICESREESYMIYILQNKLVEEYQINSTIEELGTPQSVQISSKYLFIPPERNVLSEIPKDVLIHEHVDLVSQENYYCSFFKILKKILSNINLEKIVIEFNQLYETTQNTNAPEYTQVYLEGSKADRNENRLIFKLGYILKKRKWPLISALLMIGVFYIWFLSLKEAEQKQFFVRSDLVVPTESILLQRTELLKQIAKKLEGKQDIQALALVGIGGAGKTTLARQYASLQKVPIIWELNAETKESLRASFEAFAHGLAKTQNEKKVLKEILEIENTKMREKSLLLFVQNKLRICSSWLLIYDNVGKYSDIKKYYPYLSSVWGKGKIILTTRDSTLQDIIHITRSIQIGELTSQEKLNLFMSIRFNASTKNFNAIQEGDIKQFLDNIPPFPLDISIAAYYLKIANIPYERYLTYLKKYNEDFEALQGNIIVESSDYAKTRYSIITLSLKRLIETHKDFGDLLLFISLLDSQSIPRDLLDSYKSDVIIDNFIYHLKKYSLITNNTSYLSKPVATLTMHRSTQEITLTYLKKVLNFQQDTKQLQAITYALEKYVNTIINEQDFNRMKIITSHCEKYLSHSDLLKSHMQVTIEGKLGRIYSELAYNTKAQNSLEKSLMKLGQNHSKNYELIAELKTDLGNVFKNCGNYGKAKAILEESLKIYKSSFPDSHRGYIRTLAFLGNVYRRVGHYESARNLLELSLNLTRKYFPQDYPSIAQILDYLGSTYRERGEYRIAKDLFEQSLKIYEERIPGSYVKMTGTLACLGNVHMELGNYQKAKDLLEKSVNIYRENFSEDFANVIWILTYLGYIYMELGNYQKARDLFEHSITSYEKFFSDNHIDIAWASLLLGNSYRELRNYEKARSVLKRSLDIYRQNLPEFHPEVALALMHLGNVQRDLEDYISSESLLKKSYEIFKKSYGEEHIETSRALRSLGQLYLCNGDLETSKALLMRALNVFQLLKHPEAYVSLENLAEIYIKKSEQAQTKGDTLLSKQHKHQVIQYLTQALNIIKNKFPENSPHLLRIINKLEKNKK